MSGDDDSPAYNISHLSHQEVIWFQVPTSDDMVILTSSFHQWNNPGVYWTELLRLYSQNLPLPRNALGRYADRNFLEGMDRREVLAVARREIDEMNEGFDGLEDLREELRRRIGELGGPRGRDGEAGDGDVEEENELEDDDNDNEDQEPAAHRSATQRASVAAPTVASQQPLGAPVMAHALANAPSVQNPPPPLNPPALARGSVLLTTLFNPTGSDFLPAYHASSTGMIKSILDLPRQRAIPWRAGFFGNLRPDISQARIVAVSIASRGMLLANECAKCARGTGAFGGCFVMAGFVNGACANCKWDHDSRKCLHFA